jgi:hypothetical protein
VYASTRYEVTEEEAVGSNHDTSMEFSFTTLVDTEEEASGAFSGIALEGLVATYAPHSSMYVMASPVHTPGVFSARTRT